MKCTFSLLLLSYLLAPCWAATVLQDSQAPVPVVSKESPEPGDADFPTPAPSARHAEKVAAVKAGHYDLVLIGDSITHSIGELDGKYEPLKVVWERHYAPRHAINLGHNGYRTEQILWNLQNGELDFVPSPKVAILLIGTNNSDDRHFKKVHTAEEIFAGTKAIVDLIRQRHPTTKILVLRIFPRGGDGEKGVSPPAFNSSPQCIATCRRAGELTAQLADGKNVFWRDVNHVFLRPDGTINTDLMWDLLHPSPAGAEAWAQAIEPTLAQLMEDQPLAVEVPRNSALIPVPKLENDSYDWYARHADVLRVKDGLNPEVVLIGDSITHFWGGEPKAGQANGPRSWQSTFGKYRTLNLGFGWDRIQNVLWRLDRGELDGLHPRVIVLHIGTNNTSDTANARQNTPAEVAEGIRAILQRLRAKTPDARIILMAVFPREPKPDHPRRQHILEINKLLADFGQLPGITFLDLKPKLLQPDGSISPEIMRDFCHPTEKGYQIWGEALTPWLVPAAPSGASAVGKPVIPEHDVAESKPLNAPAMDYTAVFKAPPEHVPTPGMPDGPLLGNGDIGVVLGGPAEAQAFYIGKNDFWTRHPANAKVIPVGRVELNLPGLRGATYRQEQDLALAEVRGTFTKDDLTVRTRSWVDANENLLVTQVRCEGAPVAFSVRPSAGAAAAVPSQVSDTGKLNVGREQHGAARWYFAGEMADLIVTNTVLSGKVSGQPGKPERFDGQTTWREMTAPKMGPAVSVAAWIKIASISTEANYIVSKGEWNQAYSLGLSAGRLRWAINGTWLQTEQPLPRDQWLYVAGTFDGRQMCVFVDGALQASLGGGGVSATSWFTRKADELPGQSREVAVATRVIGEEGLEVALQPGEMATVVTAILSDLDAHEFLPAAKQLVGGLTPQKIEALATAHRAWWTQFWARSFIEIPDKEIEKRWYAALYVMGSCSRAGKVAPGLWGNWVTTDNPNWHGDFHLNYNFQAPYYMVYSANHADLSLPFYQAIGESVPNGRAMAQRHGWKGVHFPVCIGPWGLFPENPDGDWGQRSDAAFAALNFIWQYQYTQDAEFLRQTAYPYLREVADFWEDYLKLEKGRYVIYNDSIHEGSGADFNPVLSLGLVRTLFKNMLLMSQDLGVDADKRAKWQDILEKLSAFPLQERGGQTVFRYSEQGLAWHDGNTLGIHHIFPAGAIGLDSDPKLREISHHMINAMHRWADYNGFSSWYTACARVGYDPKLILAKLRTECDTHSLPNLLQYYGGGGIENCGGFLAINEMLLQSHEGVLRFFPCWPKDQDARFGRLRAVGAFLASAELKAGTIQGIRIVSEKGKTCTVQNPWPGQKVQLVRCGATAQTFSGDRFNFKTSLNEIVELRPE